MFKFIHSADIHLDSPLHRLDPYEGAPVKDLRQATRRAFENLVSLALEERVSFILISGDLYDGDWRDYNTGLYLTAQLSRLREADISVYIVSGNHDAANRMTKTLRLPEGVHLLSSDHPQTLVHEESGAAIHGQGFPATVVKKDLSVLYPSPLSGFFNIGMLHTCANGREGHEPYAPCTAEGLLGKGYDYWALGHVHRREVILSRPPIVFPGNIQGRHIRETGPKGCVLVTVDDTGGARTVFHPLDVIRWDRVEVMAQDTENGYELLDRLGRRLERLMEENGGIPLVVRVEVSGEGRAYEELASDVERWTNEIRSLAIHACTGRMWIEKVRLRTGSSVQTDIPPSDHGPVGEISRVLNELRSDPDARRRLAESLSELWKKLPGDWIDGGEGIPGEDTEWLVPVLDQIRPMLLHRLLRKEEKP
jgi:DNA repair protein SbcD/Mre11